VTEDPAERVDRELIELLNELRVALPGVQVLFAFLLAVPFANGFPKLSGTGRDVFFAAFIATALSTVLLIAPSSYHRLRWRQHDKERLLIVSNALTIAGFVNSQFDQSVTWKDIEWAKNIWGGPVVLKGILSPEDARLSVEHGVDGIIVSNHGGRQLDGVRSAIAALPDVAEAAEGRLDVILDGGVRRGTDIVKALALGAKACMIGRPFLYGLAGLGGPGVALALQILRNELDLALALTGCARVQDLDASFIGWRS